MQLRVLRGGVEDTLNVSVESFSARQRWNLFKDIAELIEEGLGLYPFGFFLAARGGWELRYFRPVLGLSLSGEFAEGIDEDAAQHGLDGLTVGGCVIQKSAGNNHTEIGLRVEDAGDAAGSRSLPVRADEEVSAGFGGVHLAELGEGVGALIDDLIDPESVAKVGHLDNKRLLVKGEEAETIDHVLIRAGYEPLTRIDIVAQHGELVDGSHRDDATHQAGFRQLFQNELSVVHIDHRPAPQVGSGPDAADVVLSQTGAGHRARNGNRGGRSRIRYYGRLV